MTTTDTPRKFTPATKDYSNLVTTLTEWTVFHAGATRGFVSESKAKAYTRERENAQMVDRNGVVRFYCRSGKLVRV